MNTEGEAELAVVEVELWREVGRTTVVRAEIPAKGGGVQWSIDATKWVKHYVLHTSRFASVLIASKVCFRESTRVASERRQGDQKAAHKPIFTTASFTLQVGKAK